MSNDPSPPILAWAEPPKPGMSTGTKVILILLVVFGVFGVLCCGGVMLSGYFFGSYVNNATSQDPTKVAVTTEEITTIDVPAVLKPTGSMDIKVPFSGQRFMVMAMYADKKSDSFLMLAAMGDVGGNQAQMQQSMNQSMQQQGMNRQEEMTIDETYIKQVPIRGKTGVFMIAKGKGAQSQKARITVNGTFPGLSGPAMLMLEADPETISEEEVVRMIDSIR